MDKSVKKPETRTRLGKSWLVFVEGDLLDYHWELSPFFTTIWVRIFLEPFPTTEQAHLRKPGMKSSKRLMKCDFWQWWD